jgi:hypothetical protein
MGESIVLICPTTQREGRATDWHDGQNDHTSAVLAAFGNDGKFRGAQVRSGPIFPGKASFRGDA